jgi:hypothetical protein
MRRGQIDLDVGYGLGVPKQPQAEHSAGHVDLGHTDLLKQQAKEHFAIAVGRLVGMPKLRQVVREVEDALPVELAEFEAPTLLELLVLALEAFELGEPVVPARLQRAGDDAVFGIAGIVLPFGAFLRCGGRQCATGDGREPDR